MTTRINDGGVLEQWCARGCHWLPLTLDYFSPAEEYRTGFRYTCRTCNRQRSADHAATWRVEGQQIITWSGHSHELFPLARRKCRCCGYLLCDDFFRYAPAGQENVCSMCRYDEKHGAKAS
jgi:hypothetical protein